MEVRELIRQLSKLDPREELTDIFVGDGILVKKLPGVQVVGEKKGNQIMVIRVNDTHKK